MRIPVLNYSTLVLLICLNMAHAVAQWKPTGGPFSGYIRDLVTDGNRMHALTDQDAPYATADAGITWDFPWDSAIAARTVAFHDSVILAGVWYGYGMAVSNDYGHSWSPANSGMSDSNITEVIIHAGSAFAATTSDVYKSQNYGTNWTPANTGLAFALQHFFTDGNSLYGTAGRIYRWDDIANSWLTIDSGLANTGARCLAFDGNLMFKGTPRGVYMTPDTGLTWTQLNNGLADTSVNVLLQAGGYLYAGTNSGGIFISGDSGQTWTTTNAGLSERQVYSMCILGNTVYAGLRGGVFSCPVGGSTWQAKSKGLGNTAVQAITSDNSRIYAGADNDSYMYISADGCDSWTRKYIYPPFTPPTSIVVQDSNILMTGSSGYRTRFSSDHGEHWHDIDNGLPGYGVYSSALNGATIYLGLNTAGVYVSRDTGNSFTAAGVSGDVFSLANKGDTIFAARNSGFLKRSFDNGITWTNMNPSGGSSMVAFDDTKTVLVTGGPNSVDVSYDYGDTWTYLSGGLPINVPFKSLVCKGNHVLVGVQGYGIFYHSLAAGGNWIPINENLPDTLNYVKAIAIYHDTVYQAANIFYLPYNQGIYYRPLSNIIGAISDTVWPGDCNYDLTVDNKDFLYVGLSYQDTGSVRPLASTLWTAQYAPNWSQSFTSGINHKHADTNGDGIVDATDSTAILSNYGQGHPLRQGSQPASAKFYLVPDKPYLYPGDTVHFDMRIGSPAYPIDTLYGLAFSVLFDPVLVDTNKIYVSFSPSVMGTLNQNLISLQMNRFSSGRIDMAITRTNLADTTHVYGSIGTLSMVAAFSGGLTTALKVTPSEVYGLTRTEKEIWFVSNPDSVLVLNAKDELFQNQLSVSPNPASDFAIINPGLNIREMERLSIRNNMGQSLTVPYTILSNEKLKLDITSMTCGIYWIEFITPHSRRIGKLIVR